MTSKLLVYLFTFFCFSLQAQDVFYISSDGVRVRSGAEENARVLGLLNVNDQVKLVSSTLNGKNNFAEIIILKTNSEILNSLKYFVANQYLTTSPIDYKTFNEGYFVVINVASEMLRLYDRICHGNSCYNKMIMESEVVVGEDKNNPKEGSGQGRSILGSYRLSTWRKFYEDGARHYPSWFNENYPALPPAGVSNPALWFSPKYMPVDAQGRRYGKMRGAFGWYTALLTPNPYGQWVHGTMGWGSDKDRYIQYSKTIWTNILFDPRSSGCIRNNNEAIAFIRHNLKVGAPVIKIYAKEKIYDTTLPIYKEKMATWNYVLTKDKNLRADRNEVINALNITDAELDAYWRAKRNGYGILLDQSDPLNTVLEVGTYAMDTYPNASRFIPGEQLSRFGRKIAKSGNVYGIKSNAMRGVFFVDTGLLYEYEHPKAVLEVGGYLDEVVPPWMLK